MPIYRYHEEDSSGSGAMFAVVGAIAGFALGIFAAQRMGGVSGITRRLTGRAHEEGERYDEYEAYEDDELDEDYEDMDRELEERVLEAFRNDPTLSERAIDIGAVDDDTIELTGWVETDDEAEHAVTVARGVPGVEVVVNRLSVGEEEEMYEENARRVEEGDPALTETRWTGQRVGTGRRRQGTSADPDRHADPKPKLEDRWLSAEESLRNAAGDTAGLAERRTRAKETPRGGRTDGSSVAPTGVPKADHVADPETADEERRAD